MEGTIGADCTWWLTVWREVCVIGNCVPRKKELPFWIEYFPCDFFSTENKISRPTADTIATEHLSLNAEESEKSQPVHDGPHIVA